MGGRGRGGTDFGWVADFDGGGGVGRSWLQKITLSFISNLSCRDKDGGAALVSIYCRGCIV